MGQATRKLQEKASAKPTFQIYKVESLTAEQKVLSNSWHTNLEGYTSIARLAHNTLPVLLIKI